MNSGKALSEHESKQFLRSFGIATTREVLASSEEDAVRAALEVGFPVAVKGCAVSLAHKTELGVVRLNICDEQNVRAACRDIMAKRPGVSILVQEMVGGYRELIAGMTRYAGIGGCVMLGFGGIFVEALRKASFRVAPFERLDALEMMEDLGCEQLLGAYRGEEPVQRDLLAELLLALGRVAIEEPLVAEIDINPLKFVKGKPLAVDALVVLNEV